MKKTFLVVILLFANTYSYCQDYKTKQVHSYSADSSKIIIEEFLVYDSTTKDYKPLEIPTVDFYNYKKNPLGIRYYNFGCIKTKKSGYWLGQIDKDKFGHAIFKKPIYGIKTLTSLIEDYVEKRNKNTLYKIFNMYAPSDDCVGSIKNADGTCLYGYNKPEKYAKKVGDAFGLEINDTIKLKNEKGEIDLKLMTSLVNGITNFETGKDCKFSEETVSKAIQLNE